METLWTAAAVVAVAEIGDKTQLLAIVLAARFRRPIPIILGILAATLLNHAAAALAGYLVAGWLTGPVFQIVVALGFLAMAGWALVPDAADDAPSEAGRRGVFLTTLVAFFLVEIGDKTQIATTLLAARFHDVALVTAGTTLGMMLANVPAVYFGEAATRVVPLVWMRRIAAAVFAALGVWMLVDALH
jgi:putative Ca2+/H+ antiporter (TMEM165/GDT1 family)